MRVWYLGSIKNNVQLLILNYPALVLVWKRLSAAATILTCASRVVQTSTKSRAIWRTPTTPTIKVAMLSVSRLLKALASL